MADTQQVIEAGGTGRVRWPLIGADDLPISIASISNGRITLTNAKTGAKLNGRDDQQIISGGSVSEPEFDLEETQDDDGDDVTLLGWFIEEADTNLADTLAYREWHTAKITLEFSHGGNNARRLSHYHRILCKDSPSVCTVADVTGPLEEEGVEVPAKDEILICDAIEATAILIERFSGRKLRVSESQLTERHTALPGNRIIRLNRWPIGTIDEIKNGWGDDTELDSKTALVEGTDYYVDKENGTIERLDRDWITGRPGTIRVKHTGSGLYREVGAVDPDVRHFAARNAQWLYESRERLGVQSISQEGAATTYFMKGGMLPELAHVVKALKGAPLC